MNNNKIIFAGIVLILSLMASYNMIYTQSLDIDDNTLIISVCTGNMRGLETGISAYAGANHVPLILSDKTLPEQLSSWLPDYVQENNITKIVVVGQVSANQLLSLHSLGIEVKQIQGDSISSILTKIADNNPNKNNDTLILTASDPQAGVLGAYTNTPVFVTASNSTYQSSQYLDSNYVQYIKTHNISYVMIVGAMPDTIKTQLSSYNIQIEEITGHDTTEVSINVNNKLKSLGYLNNTTTAYYGFYGELPTIVPLAVEDNAVLIEDSSNSGNISEYLKNNNITTVYLTRNTESDYILMEEPDYVSTEIINELKSNNITVKSLTNDRTLDEATGLYDVKINTAQKHKANQINTTKPDNIIKSEPPLISMLNHSSWTDSNNISVKIQDNNTTQTVKWSTIHPYTYQKLNNTTYYITSNTGYDYYWNYINNTWTVDYQYNNTSYYSVKWIQNNDNSWTEIQKYQNYTWFYDGNKWDCYNDNQQIIYSITKDKN